MLTGYFPSQWKVASSAWNLANPQRTYVLKANKPFTRSIQSLREALLTPPPPNDWKPQVTTRPSVRLSPVTFYNTPNSPYSAQNQGSTWNPAILLRSLPGHLQSFRQSLAYWVPTQDTTIYPLNYYRILKSYLHNRHFQVKVEDLYTDLLPIKTGEPQGSVLRPLLYLLYTADLPTFPDSAKANFADDTAVLATDLDPAIASYKLQTSLLDIQHLLTKWRLKANSSKSTHVNFTTRKATCPGVHIYNEKLSQAEEVKNIFWVTPGQTPHLA
jgi:hypothetical protein